LFRIANVRTVIGVKITFCHRRCCPRIFGYPKRKSMTR